MPLSKKRAAGTARRLLAALMDTWAERYSTNYAYTQTSRHADLKNDQKNLKLRCRSAGIWKSELSPPKNSRLLSLCRWDKPGIISSRALTTDFPNEGKTFFYYVPPSLQAEHPRGQFLVEAGTNTAVFARAIMKIAYCHTVIQLGLDGFRKLCSPQIVLGKYPYISHFVGCDLAEKPRLNPTLHLCQLSQIGRPGGMKLWMQAIRLFAGMGAQSRGLPTYYAIAGAASVTSTRDD